jgi:formate dehydrogenase
VDYSVKNNKPTTTGSKRKRRHQLRGRHIDANAREQIITLLGDSPRKPSLLIEYLHLIQDHYHFISAAQLVALADELKLSQAEVYEVASFYHHFDIVKENETPPAALTIRVCDSISCNMAGSEKLITQLHQQYGKSIRIQPVPCVGRCAEAPVAVVGQNPLQHANLNTIQQAVEKNLTQTTLLAGYIDFEAYQKDGGYVLFEQCRSAHRSRDDVISQMEESSLRGLGGAGFPAGRKWRILSQQPIPRLLVVNIDEGEPGTFKDRHYLELDPHRMIEGALIAASVIDAEAVYFYIRDEYSAIRLMLHHELAKVRQHFAGKIPEMHLRRGAGAYICGEESALIESIEGKRGMPRQRPPYVAEVGLFGRPTLEHNMETLFWVRDILEKGAPWFSAHGRNGRAGFRSFSVSGRVNKPGVHLAPAGITVRELIEEFCGGMQPGHELYGYFPGGASGGILPASLDNIALDFDTLQEYDCFIGSAAIIIFSQQDSARKLALNAMKFFAHESCGQCTPCRVGTDKAVNLMQQTPWDIPLLTELAEVMADASICGLGQAAPNPLRCAIKYFPQEFES